MVIELDQEAFTWDGTHAQSRLDRIYSTHRIAEQLDRYHVCVALPWCARASDHRPVAFARTLPDHTTLGKGRLPVEAAKDPRWLPLVMEAFHNSLIRDRAYDNPLRQLVLLKRAV